MLLQLNNLWQPVRLSLAVLAIAALAGCSANPIDAPPPTIEPATPAASPPVDATPAGTVRPLDVDGQSAVFDAGTAALVVLGTDPSGASTVSVLTGTDAPRTTVLPAPAAALCGDGAGRVVLPTRGGYFGFDIADGSVDRVDVAGHESTEFTAAVRRGDGRLVLGSADGAVYTLDSEDTVGAELTTFARVDALVARGDTVVVLDRPQTLVTTVDPAGTTARHALRAGDGATTITVDPVGRVLVADTRGGELLVFGADPLMLRQRYPVPDAPYGLAGSAALTWVSQTATNTVIGYDLATGIPVEKVRYRTLQQPNSLAFDETSGTLYVVSGSGAGVQVIDDAAVQHR